jgi:hypothetical protein
MVQRLAALSFLALLTACDSPGSSGSNNLVPDSTSDASPDVADTTADIADTADTGVMDTGSPDTADTAPPDTTPPSVCALGCIPVQTATAPRGVTFQQFPDGPAPALTGGVQPTGDWVLQRIEVRPNGTFTDGVDVQIANAGQTAGRAAFGGDAIAMALDLHLSVTVTVLGTSGTDTARQEVALGGCHAVTGTRLTGQLGSCASGFPPGTTAPASLDFQHDTTNLAIGLSLTREQLIALLPEDQRESAELAITGPLYLVARFVRP